MEPRRILLFNNQKDFKLRGEQFMRQQLNQIPALKNLIVECVESLDYFSVALNQTPELVILNVAKLNVITEELLYDKTPNSRVVLLSKSPLQEIHIVSKCDLKDLPEEDHLFAQMLLVIQQNVHVIGRTRRPLVGGVVLN